MKNRFWWCRLRIVSFPWSASETQLNRARDNSALCRNEEREKTRRRRRKEKWKMWNARTITLRTNASWFVLTRSSLRVSSENGRRFLTGVHLKGMPLTTPHTTLPSKVEGMFAMGTGPLIYDEKKTTSKGRKTKGRMPSLLPPYIYTHTLHRISSPSCLFEIPPEIQKLWLDTIWSESQGS